MLKKCFVNIFSTT